MTTNLRSAAMIGVVLAAFCGSISQAAEPQKPAQMPDPEAMQQMMAEFAKVGPEHERFKHLVGTWKARTTIYCEDAENPDVSEGTAQYKLILGGRYVVEHYQGSYQGKPFEGMALCGYDNVRKKYTGVWIDNMGTGIMHTEGEFDEAAKTMTEIGEMVSPMGPMRMKMVSRHIDDNRFTYAMYWLSPDGGENKTMEIVYTRQ